MRRNKNLEFFNKFNAINKFALENKLTREGEARIIVQEDDGFVCWIISKDPLKEAIIIAAQLRAAGYCFKWESALGERGALFTISWGGS